jgi:agmatine/peptidylarginine deiminase
VDGLSRRSSPIQEAVRIKIPDAERAMKYICAAFLVWIGVSGSGFALAKDSCTHEWGKGSYKTHKQIENELRAWLVDGKILRFSLCTSGNDHYFQITILESTGKVRVVRVPAR